MKYRLDSEDLVEYLNNLRQPTQGHKKTSHPFLGDASFCTHQLPNISAIGLDLELPQKQIILSDTKPHTETINISFQLKGSMQSKFAGISHPLNMTTGVHNLIYLSGKNNGDEHVMNAEQQVSVLQVEIEKNYYLQCLEGAGNWGDKVIENVEKNVPFAAFETSLAITPRMWQLIESMRSDVSSSPLKMLMFQSRLLELLYLQIEQFNSRSNKKDDETFSQDDVQKLYVLKAYLDEFFLSDISLFQLSRICCLNEFKIKKGFKARFGDTVFGYLKKLRMQHAGHLLLDTSSTIDEVAATLGYEHTHHFSKAFKDFTGHTPSAYRS